MSTKYSLAEHVVCRHTTADLRMLFDRRKGVMYELNETASAVVGTLESGTSTAEGLCDELLAEFDIAPEMLRDDVIRLLEDFREAGLLTVEE